MTYHRQRSLRTDSHAHELQPCTRCGSIFEPTKWQRHRKSTTCLDCTKVVSHASQGAAMRAKVGRPPLYGERGLGADLGDFLRQAWR
jgi:hypothetical protein